jgi:predicted Fe-Mo cluster-binding NifX family protein
MKVAISSSGPNLNSPVDPRFGRAPYLLIVDSDTMQSEALENPNIAASRGAGIQTAQMVTNKGVQAVLTGNIGPSACDALSATGVEMVIGVRGTVRSAVERYLQGQLQPAGQSNLQPHCGFGPGGIGPMAPLGSGTTSRPSSSRSEHDILKQQVEDSENRSRTSQATARLDKPYN